MDVAPDVSMMRSVNVLAQAMAHFEFGDVPDVFAATHVTIVENFAPYLFEGSDVPARWWPGFQAHARAGELTNLDVSFGAATDHARDGDTVFFTLPTRWRGSTRGRRFIEHGGWAFVLVLQAAEWRIRSYAWAVTEFAFE